MSAPETAALAARIDDLEARAAFQERTIDDLNEMITAQWQQIDRLTRLVGRLQTRLETAIETPRGPDLPEPPPPHY